MDVLQLLSIVGAVALALAAAPFLVRPHLVENLGVTALNGNGWLELRGIYGGVLFALAMVCLVTREPYTFLSAGAALLGFAVMGFVSLAVDHPKLSQGLIVNVAHASIGLLLLAGFWAW